MQPRRPQTEVRWATPQAPGRLPSTREPAFACTAKPSGSLVRSPKPSCSGRGRKTILENYRRLPTAALERSAASSTGSALDRFIHSFKGFIDILPAMRGREIQRFKLVGVQVHAAIEKRVLPFDITLQIRVAPHLAISRQTLRRPLG